MNNKSKDYKTKKCFGQCFLKDQNIINKIIELSKIDNSFNCLEIGPGAGALTKELVKHAKYVYCFEIDNDVIPLLKDELKGYDNYKIINEDILKTDLSTISKIDNLITISNLPYYITSPIIDLTIKKLKNINKAIYMVQKEVADRLSAKVSTKDYNSFTILVNYFMEVKKIIDVPRTCFNPSPNVDSAVIELKRIERNIKPKDENLFIKVVNTSFKERRKRIVNNLSSGLNLAKEVIENYLLSLNLDVNSRGENLSITDFIKLSDLIGGHTC